MADEHAVSKDLHVCDLALHVLDSALLGDAELLSDLRLLRKSFNLGLLLVDHFLVDVLDGLLKKLKQVEGAVRFLLRLRRLLLLLLNDWLIGLMDDELNLHHLSCFRQPAGKPIIAIPCQLASLLINHIFLAIFAILLVENASLS